MIALDTNVLIRLITEDEPQQVKVVQDVMMMAENHKIKIIILSEVLIETVWVLESAYDCSRDEISMYLENILAIDTLF